jgi:hypothetical protein
MKALRRWLLITGLALAGTLAAHTDAPHPRLIATEADWQRLRQRLATDSDLAAFHEALLAEARRLVPAAPVERKLTGRRLLGVSRELLQRVLLFSYAARMLDSEPFTRRAEAEMLAAARFPDWNPSHFLDVGEASAALALGFDWLYDRLTPAARDEIARALVEKGLRPALDPKDRRNSWQRAEHNWNQVCFGGLTLAAIALIDESPLESRQLLKLARAGIANGLKPYVPDGVYPEGPSYWAYGTTYQVLMIAALESGLNTDWDLKRSPGFLASGGAYVQTAAPSGLAFNFSDGGERMAFEPAVFWFARATDDPGLLVFEFRQLSTPAGRERAIRSSRFAPLAALWWPERRAEAPRLPLAWSGDGRNPIVVFRDSWTSRTSSYLALKGGAANLNHAHMDAGSFVYESDGVRWAIDLGMQDYESLESKKIDLWNRAQNSQRWTVYRLGNFAHNTLTLDGALHNVEGRATIKRVQTAGPVRHALVDLTPVFQDRASKVTRGFSVRPDRTILIQDELAGLRAGGTVRWQFTTRAKVEIKGSTATLRQDGRTLTLRVLAPTEASFEVAPAEPPPDSFNARNPGVSQLTFTVAAPSNGALTLAVLCQPGGGAGVREPTLIPLDSWR